MTSTEPINPLQRLADSFHDHWGQILEIQRVVYERELKARAEARECRKLLREIEAVTQPIVRVTPPRLEAVPTIPSERR